MIEASKFPPRQPSDQPTNKRTGGFIAAVEGEEAGTEQERQEKKEQQLS